MTKGIVIQAEADRKDGYWRFKITAPRWLLDDFDREMFLYSSAINAPMHLRLLSGPSISSDSEESSMVFGVPPTKDKPE